MVEDEAELKKTAGIREKEAAAVAAEDKELKELIDMRQHAIAILEKEMAGGASMMQLKSGTNLNGL